MQKIFLALSLFFLVGCGSNTTPEEINQTKFKINNTTFSVEIPKSWNKISLRKDQNEIFIAEKGNENFIILGKDNYSKDIKDIILNDLKQNLFSFTLQAQSQNQWQFLGKLNVNTPQRKFYQKVISIPGTNKYLWGSCSADYIEGIESECPSILKNWKIDK